MVLLPPYIKQKDLTRPFSLEEGGVWGRDYDSMFHQFAHFEHPSFMITDTRLFNSSKILTVAVRASSQRHFPMHTCTHVQY